MGFPCAIHQALLSSFLLAELPLVNMALDRAILGLASQEVLLIMTILQQRRDIMVAEAERREPISTRFLGPEAAEVFVANSSCLVDHLTNSDQLLIDQLEEFMADDEEPCHHD